MTRILSPSPVLLGQLDARAVDAGADAVPTWPRSTWVRRERILRVTGWPRFYWEKLVGAGLIRIKPCPAALRGHVRNFYSTADARRIWESEQHV